jgi:CheY-like chemotaxis protein
LAGELVTLKTDLAPGLAPIEAEPSQVFQVLMNLVANARDAMPGGGAITISTRSVEIPASAEGFVPPCPGGAFVMLEVEDTGTGLDISILDRIFEPFYSSKAEGTGLGLAVVYAIVTQSGGHLRVRSDHGRGSRFTALFPPASSVPAPGALASSVTTRPAARTVMLVEDQDAVRAAVRTMLERLGYRVIEAASGHEAVEWVSRRGERPDVLLTDVVMPGMGGPIVVSEVRMRCPDVDVIYMSGLAEGLSDSRISGDVRAEMLSKPFTLKGLRAKLEATLERV